MVPRVKIGHCYVPWLMGLRVAQSLLGSLGRRSLGDSTSDDVPLFDAYEFADDS
jgi:hypothetical protein